MFFFLGLQCLTRPFSFFLSFAGQFSDIRSMQGQWEWNGERRGAKPKRRRWMMVARVSRLMGLGIDQDQTNRRENYASHTLKQRFTIKVIFNETLVISSYINYSQNLPKFGRPLKMSCNPGKRAWMNLSFDLKCPVTFHRRNEMRSFPTRKWAWVRWQLEFAQ